MSEIAQKAIQPARKDSPAVDSQQKTALMMHIPDWDEVEREGIPRLERTYTFNNFEEALAFTNRVGALAEEVDHHPAILLTWGRATVSWWTHVINGLHENDFIMAARTDQLYQNS